MWSSAIFDLKSNVGASPLKSRVRFGRNLHRRRGLLLPHHCRPRHHCSSQHHWHCPRVFAALGSTREIGPQSAKWRAEHTILRCTDWRSPHYYLRWRRSSRKLWMIFLSGCAGTCTRARPLQLLLACLPTSLEFVSLPSGCAAYFGPRRWSSRC